MIFIICLRNVKLIKILFNRYFQVCRLLGKLKVPFLNKVQLWTCPQATQHFIYGLGAFNKKIHNIVDNETIFTDETGLKRLEKIDEKIYDKYKDDKTLLLLNLNIQ